jgi:hypothetical protein
MTGIVGPARSARAADRGGCALPHAHAARGAQHVREGSTLRPHPPAAAAAARRDMLREASPELVEASPVHIAPIDLWKRV